MNRLLALAAPAIVAAGLVISGAAFAAPRVLSPVTDGDRVTAPGVYDISVVYIPGISVPGGLPECVDKFDQQIYVGKLTVSKTSTGSHMSFVGENIDDSTLSIRASGDFNANWGGFLLGPLGGREDALMGIDYANMIGGRIVGRVRGQNGLAGTVIVQVGAGGVISSCRFVGPAVVR